MVHENSLTCFILFVCVFNIGATSASTPEEGNHFYQQLLKGVLLDDQIHPNVGKLTKHCRQDVVFYVQQLFAPSLSSLENLWAFKSMSVYCDCPS